MVRAAQAKDTLENRIKYTVYFNEEVKRQEGLVNIEKKREQQRGQIRQIQQKMQTSN